MLPNCNHTGTNSASLDETIIEVADAIIGGLILDEAAITRMHDIADPKDFPTGRHQLIVQIIKNLHQQKPIDRQRVRLKRHRRRQLEEAVIWLGLKPKSQLSLPSTLTQISST